MGKTLSIKLTNEQVERLEEIAGRYHLKPSQMAATFLEEKMREEEFPHIRIREGFENRQAYIAGTRLKVWMMERMARHCAGGAGEVARLLEQPAVLIEAARAYAAAFPQEVEKEIAEGSPTYEEMKEKLPNLEQFVFHDPGP